MCIRDRQKTALGDVQLLGGADQQPRIQFLFQGIDVGTDGGLGQIQLAGGFREAFIFDYGYEGDVYKRQPVLWITLFPIMDIITVISWKSLQKRWEKNLMWKNVPNWEFRCSRPFWTTTLMCSVLILK